MNSHNYILCRGSDILDGQMRAFQAGDVTVVIARIEGRFYAFNSQCPHRQAPLHKGYLTKKACVVCPLHQWSFSLTHRGIRVLSFVERLKHLLKPADRITMYPIEDINGYLNVYISSP